MNEQKAPSDRGLGSDSIVYHKLNGKSRLFKTR
jgi:hypothetical protein